MSRLTPRTDDDISVIDVATCSAAVAISVAVPATAWIDEDDCSIAVAVLAMNDVRPLMLPARPSIDAAISLEPDSVSSVAARIDSASDAVSVQRGGDVLELSRRLIERAQLLGRALPDFVGGLRDACAPPR